MISMEAWTTIRYLRARGMGTRAIAKEVGVSRNTVKRALGSTDSPKYERAPRPNPEFERFKETVRRMLMVDRFIGSRILEEIRAMGYEGSQSAFYRYLSQIKDEEKKSKASMRYETLPGEQAQFDWSPYTVPIDGRLTRVVVFRLIFGFSRYSFHFASLDETQASIFEGIESGLTRAGGVPNDLVVDNARSFVIDARPKHFQWNPRFLELCGYYSMKPVACRVRNPRAKGKVEKPFYYLEQHFIKGRSWKSFEHFCHELAQFEDEVNLRVNETTQEKPIDRFQQEAGYLVPLPPSRFISSQELFRHVSWDGLVAFGGSRYSLPPGYVGKEVWVRPSQGRYLDVYDQRGNPIFRHMLSERKGAVVIVKEHYEELKRRQGKTRAVLEEQFMEQFPDQRGFLEKLYVQQKLNPVAHLKPIMELAGIYSKEVMVRAFTMAHWYNTFSHHFIRGLLEKEMPAEVAPDMKNMTMWSVPAIKVDADLSAYQKLVEGKP